MLKFFPLLFWIANRRLFAKLGYSESLTPTNIINGIPDNRTNSAGFALELLPGESYPERYNIEFNFLLDKKKKFSVNLFIDVVVTRTTQEIVLHVGDINNVAVMLVGPSTFEMLESKYDSMRQHLSLKRPNDAQFSAGSTWQLRIIYRSSYLGTRKGLYKYSYAGNAGNTYNFVATNFLNTFARWAFPCYDEPNKSAHFIITINHSSNFTAVANMPARRTSSSATRTVFQTTERIPPHLVSFVVTDLEFTKVEVSGTDYLVYSRHNAKHEHDLARNSSIHFTEFFSEYFDIDLKLSEIVHIAMPGLRDEDSETGNLLIYSENSLLYNPEHHNIFCETLVKLSISYKSAQRWLGHYVAKDKMSMLWYLKGAAILLSYKAFDNIYVERNVWQIYHNWVYQQALDNDNYNSEDKYLAYSESLGNITERYYRITKIKAASIWQMWNNALGEEIFRKSLRSLLNKNRYNIVTARDLFDAFQTTLDEEKYHLPARISNMLRSWFSQSSYPLLTVARNYEDGSFDIKQEAFTNNGSAKNAKTWHIPFNYAEASDPDFLNTTITHYLLNKVEMAVSSNIPKTDWLIVNKQSMGYFRVNYDEENWNLITKSLIENPSTIHVRNRAQLIHDAYTFTLSNRLKHSTFLYLLTYLKQETECAPWVTAYTILKNYIKKLRGDEKFNDFKLFVKELVSTTYKKFTFSDTLSEDFNNNCTRGLVAHLACWANVMKCLQREKKQLKNFLKYNKTAAAQGQGAVFCNALRQSSDVVYNATLEVLTKSEDKQLRKSLITSLGCSEKRNQINNFIANSINKTFNLDNDERRLLFRSAYEGSDVGVSVCIEFLNKNWNIYQNLTNNLEEDILEIAKYINKEDKMRKLVKTVFTISDNIYGRRILVDATKQINENLEWAKKYGQPIMAWISQYHTGK